MSCQSRERKEAQESESLLDGVGEFNVLQVFAHDMRRLRAHRRLAGLRQEGVRELALLDLHVAHLGILATSIYEGDFVIPPHHVVPVWLVILFELCVELKVFPNAHHDILLRHSGPVLVHALVPLALAEVESSHTQSHVDDGPFLGGLRL